MKSFSGSSLLQRGAIRWLAAAASAGALIMAGTHGSAQPPAAATARTVEGKVQRMTTAPMGEIDGAVLDDGTWLHWPPHFESQFTGVVKSGDRIRASGRTERGPAGDEHFEIKSLTNTSTNATAENVDFASGPPAGPRGPRSRGRRVPPHLLAAGRATGGNDAAQESSTREGKVQRLTTAPRGEVDGAVLDDGTWIHWPPHLQGQFNDVVKVGDRVRVTGQTETGPAGDTHFEVQSVTNILANRTVENPESIAAVRPSSERTPQLDGPSRERRLRELESQIEQMQRELGRLRLEK